MPPALPAPRNLHIVEMCTQFGVGGITRHALSLSAWLRAAGHRVTLAGTPDAWAGPGASRGASPGASRGASPGASRGASPDTDEDPPFLDLPTRWVAGDGGSLPARLAETGRAALRLRRFLARERPDVIHAHESAPALVARLARMGLSGGLPIPLVVTFHGAEPGRIGQFGRIARGAEAVIALSAASEAALAGEGGVPAARLRRIGLGIPPAPPPDPAASAALRARFLGDGTALVVSVLRFTPQKGVDILIETVARTMRTAPGIRYVVAGDGPLFGLMQAKAQEAGVTGHLAFAGRTATPHLFLRAGDLFLLPSRWEAMPFTIVEAFQAGIPALATATGGVAELIDAAVGRIVPPEDPGALAEAVTDLLSDPARRAAMGQAALARAAEPRFDAEAAHARIAALYAELAARP